MKQVSLDVLRPSFLPWGICVKEVGGFPRREARRATQVVSPIPLHVLTRILITTFLDTHTTKCLETHMS
jgi:hypothetical protein